MMAAGVYLFKINNRNARTVHKVWSKLTIKTLIDKVLIYLDKVNDFSGVFIVNFVQI